MAAKPRTVSLVFDQWRNEQHASLRLVQRGVNLAMGSFHGGSTFPATILLDEDDWEDLCRCLREGGRPIFELQCDHGEASGGGSGTVES